MAGHGHVHNRITTVGDSCTSSSLGVYSPDTKGGEKEKERERKFECILQLDRVRQSDLFGIIITQSTMARVEKPGKR